MSGRNAYLANREARDTRIIYGAQATERQFLLDILAIKLNEMYGFGEARIVPLINAITEQHDTDADMFDNTFVDADYKREVYDRQLRNIMPVNFEPWDDRYPYAKSIKYDGKQKFHE